MICKVASIYSLNSKQVSLLIFTSGQLNFFLYYILIEIFSCVFLIIDFYFKWFCLFINFGRIKRIQFV